MRAHWIFLFVLFSAAPASAQSSASQTVLGGFQTDFSSAGALAVNRESQYGLLLASSLVIAAHHYDPAARDEFAGARRIGELEPLGNNVLGTGIPGVLVGGGLWVYGSHAEDDRAHRAGRASLEALTMSFVLTSALKVTVQRTRPDASDQQSFPSGHTSTMATSAMVLQEYYGWKAGVPAFALTALTAVSRMSADKHWLSDTVAGASLGVLVGHAFSNPALASAQRDGPPRMTWMALPMGEGVAISTSY